MGRECYAFKSFVKWDPINFHYFTDVIICINIFSFKNLNGWKFWQDLATKITAWTKLILRQGNSYVLLIWGLSKRILSEQVWIDLRKSEITESDKDNCWKERLMKLEMVLFGINWNLAMRNMKFGILNQYVT